MSNGECGRCGGEGMGQHKDVAGGVCFECGRLPAGGVASPVQLASARERMICRIASALRMAQAAANEGTLAQWWADAGQDEEDLGGAVVAGIATYVKAAPADVRARAVAAFGRLGITV